jgi:hypothetical protein
MAEARGGGKTDLRDPLTGVPSAAGALHPRGSSDAQAPRLEQTRSWGSSHPPTARSSGVPAGRAASRVVEPDLGWSSLSRPRRRGGRAGPPGGRACRDHWRTFAGLRPDERAGTPARSFLARPPDPGQPRPLVRAAPDSRDVWPPATPTPGWSSLIPGWSSLSRRHARTATPGWSSPSPWWSSLSRPRQAQISTSSISRDRPPGHSDVQLTRLARDFHASAAKVHV